MVEEMIIRIVREHIEISWSHGIVAQLAIGNKLEDSTIVRLDNTFAYLENGKYISFEDIFYSER